MHNAVAYRVFLNGARIATVRHRTTFTGTGRPSAAGELYTVQAIDAAGGAGAISYGARPRSSCETRCLSSVGATNEVAGRAAVDVRGF